MSDNQKQEGNIIEDENQEKEAISLDRRAGNQTGFTNDTRK